MGGNAHFVFCKWLKNRYVITCNTLFCGKNVKHFNCRKYSKLRKLYTQPRFSTNLQDSFFFANFALAIVASHNLAIKNSKV